MSAQTRTVKSGRTGEIIVLTMVPGDLRRQVIPPEDIATCGTCGRSWDDGQGTSVTPTPSGRCPFEYDHDELELVEAAPVNVPDEEPRTVRDLIDAWEAFDGDDVDDFFREWEPVFRPVPNDVERMYDVPSPTAPQVDLSPERDSAATAPEADALDRIAALVKGTDWTDEDESYCGYESAVTAIAAILRETGRL